MADYAKMRNATAIVKGLRALSDFEYEFQMALTNKKLNPMLDTLFLATSAEYMFLSSSMVKQVASFGGDISAFVPSWILEEIRNGYPGITESAATRINVGGFCYERSKY